MKVYSSEYAAIIIAFGTALDVRHNKKLPKIPPPVFVVFHCQSSGFGTRSRASIQGTLPWVGQYNDLNKYVFYRRGSTFPLKVFLNNGVP